MILSPSLFAEISVARNTTLEPLHLYASVLKARKKQHRVSRQGRHVMVDGRRLTWAQFEKLFPTEAA